MHKDTKEVLRKLVGYIIEAERRHWEDCDKPEEHAYSYAVTLAHWLNKSDVMAEVRR